MQTVFFGVYLSLIGSRHVLMVIGIGVARKDGTFFLVCGSTTVTPWVSGTWPLTSWAIAFAAGPGLVDGRLVDREALVTVEDVLQTLGSGVLTGHRDLALEVLTLDVGDHGAGHRVVRDHDGLDVRVLAEHRVELAPAVGASQLPSCSATSSSPEAWTTRCRSPGESVALLSVGGAVDLDELDVLLGLDLRADRECLALQLADLDVVEGT